MRSPREVAREVLETEAVAIRGLLPQLDERFDRAVALMQACTGRVVCTGMGKSGLILKKIAATLASTGTPAFFLHPAEAVHGDLGMITPRDVAGRLAARARSGVSGASDRPSARCGAVGDVESPPGELSLPPESLDSASSVGRSPTWIVTVACFPPRTISSGTRDPTGVLAIRYETV